MAEREGLREWQSELGEALLSARDPEVAMSVLQETLSTASNQVSLEPIGEISDEMLAGVQAQLASEGIEGDLDAIARDALTRPHAQIVSRPEEVDDGVVIKMATGGDKIADLVMSGMKIDRTFFTPGKLPSFVEKEYAEGFGLNNKAAILLCVLYRHFGEEVLDLCAGLAAFILKHDPDFAQKIDICSLEEISNKQGLVEALVARYTVPDESIMPVLKWALGGKLFDSLNAESDGCGELLDNLAKLLAEKEGLRRKFKRAFAGMELMGDRIFASMFVRQGWRTMLRVPAISDHEWWTRYKQHHEAAEKSPEVMAMVAQSEARQRRHAARAAAMEKFFEENPEPPEELRYLADVIDCQRYRREIIAMKKAFNITGEAAKQKELANRIFAEVSKFIQKHHKEGESIPTYERGFPTVVAEMQETSCFSGPWLVAVLLMHSGVDYGDLFYCHVNKGSDGQIGGHGAIVLRTKKRELIMIDHGYMTMGRELLYQFCEGPEMARDFGEFLEGKGKQKSVPMRFDDQMRRVLGIHSDMQIMPLQEGFASGHLLHVGIEFFHEGELDEAEHALLLALNFNPHDADALYHLGMIERRRGNLAEAKAYFAEAIEVFNEYLWAHNALGEIAQEEGDDEEALRRFRVVAENESKIFGGDDFRQKAKEYVAAA